MTTPDTWTLGDKTFTIDQPENTVATLIERYDPKPGQGRLVTLIGASLNPIYTENRRDFDLVLLDGAGRVVDVHQFTRTGPNAPYRPTKRYQILLGLPAGTVKQTGVRAGQALLSDDDLRYFQASPIDPR